MGALSNASSWYIMHPQHPARAAWTVMILALVVYNAISLPFVVAFIPRQPVAWVWFDYVVDALFIFDLAINFCTAYYGQDEVLVDEPSLVRRQYLRGWFFIDLLASLPIELIIELFSGGVSTAKASDRTIRLLSAVKCVRLLRLGRFAKLLDRLQLGSIWSIFRLYVVTMLVAHWLACVFYLVIDDYPDHNWLTQQGVQLLQHPPEGGTPTNLGEVYVTCLMGALLALLRNVGHMPVQIGEKLFVFFVVLLGAGLHAIIFGEVALVVGEATREENEYKRKRREVFKRMNRYHFPDQLQARVAKYYESMWSKYATTDHNEVLTFTHGLSEPLALEVHLFLNRDMILRVPMFANSSPSVIISLVKALVHHVYVPGDYIVRQGEIGDRMFFVRTGVCEVLVRPVVDESAEEEDVRETDSPQAAATMKPLPTVISLETSMQECEPHAPMRGGRLATLCNACCGWAALPARAHGSNSSVASYHGPCCIGCGACRGSSIRGVDTRRLSRTNSVLQMLSLQRRTKTGALAHQGRGQRLVPRTDADGRPVYMDDSLGEDLIVVKSMGPGDFFGEISLLFKVARTATIVATRYSDLSSIDSIAFEEILENHPDFAKQLAGSFKQYLRLPPSAAASSQQFAKPTSATLAAAMQTNGRSRSGSPNSSPLHRNASAAHSAAGGPPTIAGDTTVSSDAQDLTTAVQRALSMRQETAAAAAHSAAGSDAASVASIESRRARSHSTAMHARRATAMSLTLGRGSTRGSPNLINDTRSRHARMKSDSLVARRKARIAQQEEAFLAGSQSSSVAGAPQVDHHSSRRPSGASQTMELGDGLDHTVTSPLTKSRGARRVDDALSVFLDAWKGVLRAAATDAEQRAAVHSAAQCMALSIAKAQGIAGARSPPPMALLQDLSAAWQGALLQLAAAELARPQPSLDSDCEQDESSVDTQPGDVAVAGTASDTPPSSAQ